MRYSRATLRRQAALPVACGYPSTSVTLVHQERRGLASCACARCGTFPNPDNRKQRSLACRAPTPAMTTVLACLSTIVYRELTHRIAGQRIHSAHRSAVGLRRESILLGYDGPLDVVRAHDRNSGSAASRLLAELRVLRERQACSSCEGLPGIWRQVVRPPIWRLRSYAQADQQNAPLSRGIAKI